MTIFDRCIDYLIILVVIQQLLIETIITEKPRGEVKGQTERTITDKKRERRMKKSLQHDKRLRKEDRERENKDSNNKTAALEKLVKSHKEGKISTVSKYLLLILLSSLFLYLLFFIRLLYFFVYFNFCFSVYLRTYLF